jgi:outer membrane protein assembly factor BamB
VTRSLFTLVLAAGLASAALAADWPQWRGPNRDGISKETGLLPEWPKDGPPLRWKAEKIGTGYSTPAVAGGKVFVQTTKENDEFALALDEKSGKELWTAPIGQVGKNKGPQYPGTRSTPTVDGDRVYCLSSAGQLVCLDTAGKAKWRKDFVNDFGGRVGGDMTAWAYSESVLIDGNVLVCTPGGETATLLALNKLTGDVIWKAAVPGGDAADYASVMPVVTDGGKQYVQFLRGGVVGVDAKTGKFLWRYAKTADKAANMLTPVVQGNRVYTSARNGGSVVELTAGADGVKVNEVYFDKDLTAGIGGAVLVDGHLYGTSGVLFCVEFATGKEKWTDRCVGPAALCYADGRLYVRGQNGEVALVEPSPEGYREKGRFKVDNQSKYPAWPHPVVANGGLYLRDQGVLMCYDVRDPKGGKTE